MKDKSFDNILGKIFKWSVDDNDCWNVTSHYKEKQGYHRVMYKTKQTRAHRLSYLLTKGDIKKGFVVMHLCDNRSCINPNHLKAGTKKDNTQDMIKKNRQSDRSDRKGKMSKLNRQQVIDIYLSCKSSYQLSKKYNVTDVQIRRIRSGSRCSSITNLYKNHKKRKKIVNK